MTDAHKAMNPQHFYSDPADMRIRIRIPDHFWLTFQPGRSLHSLSALVVVVVFVIIFDHVCLNLSVVFVQ